MSKLYPARIVLSTLGRAGFTVVSQRGSHIKLQKRDGNKVFTVIVPNYREIPIGTFNSILKQAGITRKEFEEFI